MISLEERASFTKVILECENNVNHKREYLKSFNDEEKKSKAYETHMGLLLRLCGYHDGLQDAWKLCYGKEWPHGKVEITE